MFREDEHTEFKKTTAELTEAMCSISAILNKHGEGTLYFGVKNDGTPFPFTIADSTLRDVSRKVFEAIKPQIFPSIEVVKINETDVISVHFSGTDLPYSAYGKYYIRTADEDRELSPAELRRIMIGKEYEDNWENHTTTEALEDVDEQTIQRFYRSATECGRLPDVGEDNVVLLNKMGLLNGDKLTNAGRCLFSKNKPIMLKLAVFATDHKTTFLDMAQIEGNIFQLIDAAMNYLVRNIRWRVNLSEDGIHRTETPEIPIEVLREAIINSFAHARYDIPVRHEIDIYSNRISIINPGSFANEFTPQDYASRDLHSFLRNELIAKTLYLCKDVETFGSGIKKIYRLCSENNVGISYTNTDNDFMIEFSRVDRNIVPNGGIINGTNGTITEDEAFVMSLLREDPHRTVDQLIEISGKSRRTLNRIISTLKAKKLICRNGSNRTGYWEVL
ncbi:MAG: putative DNA binding domain-containing protein [Erysipelotrichaceae bacterium]|nr:putative DNA binding domain-containing protein [Erysipelotrichaceae bacterium]